MPSLFIRPSEKTEAKLHDFFPGLAGAELGKSAGLDFDFFAGGGIYASAGSALNFAESAETDQRYVIAFLYGALDYFKHGGGKSVGIFFGDMGDFFFFEDGFDQFFPVHSITPGTG